MNPSCPTVSAKPSRSENCEDLPSSSPKAGMFLPRHGQMSQVFFGLGDRAFSNDDTHMGMGALEETTTLSPTSLGLAIQSKCLHCEYCQKLESPKEMIYCDVCLQVFYCSKDCFNADMTTHKSECTRLDVESTATYMKVSTQDYSGGKVSVLKAYVQECESRVWNQLTRRSLAIRWIPVTRIGSAPKS